MICGAPGCAGAFPGRAIGPPEELGKGAPPCGTGETLTPDWEVTTGPDTPRTAASDDVAEFVLLVMAGVAAACPEVEDPVEGATGACCGDELAGACGDDAAPGATAALLAVGVAETPPPEAGALPEIFVRAWGVDGSVPAGFEAADEPGTSTIALLAGAVVDSSSPETCVSGALDAIAAVVVVCEAASAPNVGRPFCSAQEFV